MHPKDSDEWQTEEQSRPEAIKRFFFFLLICVKKKYLEIQQISESYTPTMLLSLLINIKMPTIVGILTFMSRKNSMLN